MQLMSQTTTCGPGGERNDPPITPAPLPLPELTPSDNGLAPTGRFIGYSVPPETSPNDLSCPPEVFLWNIRPDNRGGSSPRPTRYLRMDHPQPQEPPDLALGPPFRPQRLPGAVLKIPHAPIDARNIETLASNTPWAPPRNPPVSTARDGPPEPTYRSGGYSCHSYCPSRPPPPSPQYRQDPLSRR